MTEQGLILVWLRNILFSVWCGLLFTLGGRDWSTGSTFAHKVMLALGKGTRRFGIAISIAIFFLLRSVEIWAIILGLLYFGALIIGYGINSKLKRILKFDWLVRIVNGVAYGVAPLVLLGVQGFKRSILISHLLCCILVNTTVKAEQVGMPAAINEAYVGFGITLFLPWII